MLVAPRRSADLTVDVPRDRADPADSASEFVTLPATEPASTDGPAELPIVAGYEILGELGRGAMGVVYKALQFNLNRLVALKMVLAGGHAAATDLVRFLAEAEAIAQLQHSHIVQIHEVGKHGGLPFLSLEYVDGGTLTQKLLGEPQQPREAARLIERLARAVHFAHQHGIVHRDIKPSNVLLTSDGVPKITDFGLAKRGAVGTGMTQTGAILGTPSYMAPEQAEAKKEIGPAADTYSLGAIFYEMLTGRPPFRAPTPLDTVLQVISEEPVPPRQLQSKVPRDLETICLKCLQKDPRKRYASAEELADDLARFLADQPIVARPVGRLERAWRLCRRNPVIAGMTAAVALLLVVLAVGASVAAFWLDERRIQAENSQQQAEKDQIRAVEAERDGQIKLAQSYLDEARARRFSRQMGQRFQSLAALEKAAKIVLQVDKPDDKMVRDLRNEVLAASALPDLRIDREWEGFPPGNDVLIFDDTLERYARRDDTGAISVRRVADDNEIRLLPGSEPGWGRYLYVLRFSPDGRYLAATYHPGHQLKVWDLERDEPIFTGKPNAAVYTADFTPDGGQIAFVQPDGSIRLVDLATGQGRSLPAHGTPIHFFSFSPDGKRLALSAGDKQKGWSLQVRSVETGDVLADFLHPEKVGRPAWHPDGVWVVAPCDDKRFYLWDVVARKQTAVLEGYKNVGLIAAFSPVGDLLATNGWEASMRLWDPRTGKELLRTFASFHAVQFSRDGRRLAGRSLGTKVGIFEVADGREYRTLVSDPARGKELYNDLSVSPDSRLLAAGVNDGAILWDLEAGKELAFLPTGARTPGALFLPGGNLLTGSLTTPGLQLWPVRHDPETPEHLRVGPRRSLYDGPVERIASNCNGQVVAFNPAGDGARIVNPESAQVSPLLHHFRAVHIAASPDGQWIASGTHGGQEIKVWRSRDNQLELEVPTMGGASPTFSPDGRWLAICTSTECQLRRVGSWEKQRVLPSSDYHAFAFSPDSRLLAVMVAPAVIGLIDPETGRTLARLEDPNQDAPISLCFTPDGTQLAATTNDGQAIRVWNLRLLRERLVALGLDWDVKYKPTAPPGPAPRISVVGENTPPPVVFLPPKEGHPATPEEIAKWVRALGGDAEAREKAVKELEAVGPPALKALAEIADDPMSPIRQRARELWERIAIAEALAPRRISLKLNDADVADAVKALAEQSGVRLEYLPQATSSGTPKNLTLELNGVPFWEALDRLCREARLVYTQRDGQSLRLTAGVLPRSELLAYAGPFRIQADRWSYQRVLPLPEKDPTSNEFLHLQLLLLGEPHAPVVGVGWPRILEARDADGQSRVPTVLPAGPNAFEPYSPSLWLRGKFLHFRPTPKPKGTLKLARGTLPVEVMVARQDLVTVTDLGKAKGQAFHGEEGVRLTIRNVEQLGNRLAVQFTMTAPAGWTYKATLRGFDLIDGKGQRFHSTAPNLSVVRRSEVRPEDLAWLGAAPGGGFPANVPWTTLAMAGGKGPTEWTGTVDFFLSEKMGPDAKLIFYRGERVRAELPFEFRDLPLP
jgi:WD40 repeat protein